MRSAGSGEGRHAVNNLTAFICGALVSLSALAVYDWAWLRIRRYRRTRLSPNMIRLPVMPATRPMFEPKKPREIGIDFSLAEQGLLVNCLQLGDHLYPPNTDGSAYCIHGCGCWIGKYGESGGPDDLDPTGHCPMAHNSEEV